MSINRLLSIYVIDPDRETVSASDWQPRWSDACLLSKVPTVIGKEAEINGLSKYVIARCYLDWDTKQRNVPKGIALYIQAAKVNKSSRAARKLADIYKTGKYGVGTDLNRAIEWESVALENEALESEWSKCLENGLGLESRSAEKTEKCGALMRIYLN